MGWVYLLAALVLPPVFILWRPRTAMSPRERRVRIAGSVVVVWMVTILWYLRAPADGEFDADLPPEARAAQGALIASPAAAAGGPVTQPANGTPDPAARPGGDAADLALTWSYDAPRYSGPVLMFGWVPGLVYTGLLLLARRAVEPPPPEFIDAPGYPGWTGRDPRAR